MAGTGSTATAESPTRYRCPDSGIEAAFGADCVPVDLYIPERMFGLPHTTLAGLVCDALNTGAVWSQQQQIAREEAADPGAPAAMSTAPEIADDAAPPAGPVDVEACMERLHGVADLLADAHLELQSARYRENDPDGQVRAGANSAGAVVELEVAPQFAARGPAAGTKAVLQAVAAAVRAANRARAEVIERALGAILQNSLAAGRHEAPGYL